MYKLAYNDENGKYATSTIITDEALVKALDTLDRSGESYDCYEVVNGNSREISETSPLVDSFMLEVSASCYEQ